MPEGLESLVAAEKMYVEAVDDARQLTLVMSLVAAAE